jgi:hypothetical protein
LKIIDVDRLNWIETFVKKISKCFKKKRGVYPLWIKSQLSLNKGVGFNQKIYNGY